MKVKGIAAILAVFIGLFGYAVVDKNYVADTEKQLTSYESQVASLQNANSDYSRQISSLGKSNIEFSSRLSYLEGISREYASHVCTTSSFGTGDSTTTTNSSGPNNPVTGPIAWEDLKIGMEIPVVIDIRYAGTDNDDFSYSLSDAKATITDIPSSTKIKYTLSAKLTVTRKVSTYNAYNTFIGYVDYDGNYKYPGMPCEETVYGVSGHESALQQMGICGKNDAWVNNTVTYLLSTDSSIYADHLNGTISQLTIYAYEIAHL